MSGVFVIRTLLAADGAVTAIVASANIRAGVSPLGTIAPFIGVTLVDSIPYGTIKQTPVGRMHTDRVQVSVLTKDSATIDGYLQLRQLLLLVLKACPGQHATIGGVKVLAIREADEGPDLSDPSLDFYSGSRDFFVSWEEVA